MIGKVAVVVAAFAFAGVKAEHGVKQSNSRHLAAGPVPDEWTCDPAIYGAGDGCDCGCGTPDADCTYGTPINGCEAGQHCSYLSECIDVPPIFHCNPFYFNVSDGCDCACGVVDPDCFLPEQTLYNCDEFQACTADGLCIDAPPTNQPTPEGLPEGWTCRNIFYGQGDGCDCNCGAHDPDCDIPGAVLFNCEEDALGCFFGACVYREDFPGSAAPTFFPTALAPTSLQDGILDNPVLIAGVTAVVAVLLGLLCGVIVCLCMK